MSLNNLTLDELRRISDWLVSVAHSGFRLEQDGLAPRFDLTPGQPVRITLAVALPAALEAPAVPSFLQPQRSVADSGMMDAIIPPSIEAAPDLTQSGEAGPARPEPEETSPASGDSAGGDLISEPARAAADDVAGAPAETGAEADAQVSLAEAASDAGAVTGSGGGEAVAAAGAPAAPVPGSASALAANAGGTKVLWTEEEDDRLVAYIVEAVTVRGLTKRAAIPLAAAELGRPAPGTEFRANRALKDRINASIFAAATRQAQTEAPEIPASDTPMVADGDAAVGDHTPAAVQDEEVPTVEDVAATFARSMPLDPSDLHGDDLALWRFLQQNRPKWPMTAGTDLDLIVGLGRGEKLPSIAVDLGIDTEALKLRYHTLTSRVLDARGNVTIEGGTRLIKLLRRIAKTPAVAG